MKITGLESRRYRIALEPPFRAAWDPVPRTGFEETVVLVHTDESVTGVAGGAPVPDIGLLAHLLDGVEVSDIDAVSRICTDVDFHHGRNWVVEVAVMDAWARAEDMPLWQLLGGGRPSLPAYASTGERVPAGERVDRTRQWVEAGIGAIKIRFGAEDLHEDIAVVAAVRAALGDRVEIMVDANQGWRMPGDRSSPWDLERALECARALADLDVYWLEEPLPARSVDDYAELRDRSGLRIAGGEMVRSLAETRRLVFSGAYDVVQNDVVLAGGIAGARRVAGWAGRAGITWSPHTWGTGLGLIANLHAAQAFSTAEWIEVPFDPPGWAPRDRDFMLAEPVEIGSDGTIRAPEGPGLGVWPDLDALERFRLD